MYKALLVDDEALTREAIKENIHWEEAGFTLVGTCENGREAVEAIKSSAPDLVLTDICMPYMDGLELAEYICGNCPETRTVIISGYDEFEYAKKAVRYRVMEYILKPVTPAELTEVLRRAKESLDEERQKARTLKELEAAWRSNKPFLRGRFLNSLLRGDEDPDTLDDKMRELDVSLTGNCFNTAIVEGDDLTPFVDNYQNARFDLALFSICNIATEIVERKGAGTAFQDLDERTVVIFHGEEPGELEKNVKDAVRDIRKVIKELLKIEVTVSIGETVTDINRLHFSFERAKAALNLKWLFGGNSVLRPGQLEPAKNTSIDVGHWAKQVMEYVKAGDDEGIGTAVEAFAQELREARTDRDRCIIYMQNLLLSVVNNSDLEEEQEAEIMSEERELLNRLYTYERLTYMAADVTSVCRRIAGMMNERKDSYGRKQAMKALEYIDQNYMDSGIGLSSVCGSLSISTSYFSTIFKANTGETFIEALTKKRIEKAKELLEGTSKKAYEVAAEVGYSDPHYFSIAFKKVTGMTPTEYAREKRAK